MKKKIALFLAIVLCFSCFCYTQASAKKVQKPKLNIKKLNLTVGRDFQIRAYNLKKKQKITFSTSNANVVAIKNKSKKRVTITAVSVGSATITGTVKKGKKIIRTLKCKVKVSPNAVSIKFLKRQVKVMVNHKRRLETIVKPNISQERPVFESDNPEVATVNSRGVVTAISPGTTTITATLLSCDVSTTCTVTVLPDSDEYFNAQNNDANLFNME